MKTDNHNASKEFYEVYASLVLKDFVLKEGQHITLQDKPDLLVQPGNIGVEVTRVLFPKEAETGAFFDKYKGLQQEQIPAEKLEKLKNNGFSPLFYQGKFVGFGDDSVYCINETLFLKAYREKTAKLKGYAGCEQVELFMFAPLDWYEKDHFEAFVRKAQQIPTPGTLHYSKVYVIQHEDLFICDMVTGTVDQIKIPYEKLIIWKATAKEKAYSD